MIKSIALAGGAAALVIGTIAVAQTASGPSDMSNNNNAPNASQTTTGAANTGQNGANSSAAAPSAGQYSSDTSATASTAGERG
jgi:hypothetical protein